MDAVAVSGVEVYDSPRHFTRNGTYEPVHKTMLVVGVSAEIRAVLRINGEWDDHDNYATVRRGQGSSVRVRVVCTDSRLMSGGEAQADNPSCHCWMTPEVRDLLQERDGLPDDAQVPAPHRAQYPAFKKKFAPVSLAKATIPNPVHHNGYAYRSLYDHDPTSRQKESGIRRRTGSSQDWQITALPYMFHIPPGWELCPKTPDALHVCSSYPWACCILVFADGSAHHTGLASGSEPSAFPGDEAVDGITKNALATDGAGRYGMAHLGSRWFDFLDVLLRRRLPFLDVSE